jgi:hypothetical protein
MQSPEEVLKELINKHYDYLIIVAKRIIGANKKSEQEKFDLLNGVLDNILTRGKDFKSTITRSEDDFIKYVSKCMKNEKVLFKSRHNKFYIPNRGRGFIAITDWDEVHGDKNQEAREIEILAENTSEAMREYIIDTERNNLPHKAVSDYLEVISIKNSLPLPDKQLFVQAFENEKSGRAIAREMSLKTKMHIPHGNINLMINELRETIKTRMK